MQLPGIHATDSVAGRPCQRDLDWGPCLSKLSQGAPAGREGSGFALTSQTLAEVNSVAVVPASNMAVRGDGDEIRSGQVTVCFN